MPDTKEAVATEEVTVYCVGCGSPDHLKVVEVWGKTPVEDDVNPHQKDWIRYWVKCFKCGGRQIYDSPDEGLVVPPEPDFLGEDGGLKVDASLEELANSGVSLASKA